MDSSVPVSVLAGGLSEWQRCTGCRNRPPPPHPQPLCCHLLTRGRLRRTLPLAAPTPCPVARPMRARLAAGVGECASRCHIRAAATGGWRLSPPGGPARRLSLSGGESTLSGLPSIPRRHSTLVNGDHLILSFILSQPPTSIHASASVVGFHKLTSAQHN